MTRLPDQRPGSTRTLLREDDGGLVRRTVLPGGLRVITEAMPTVRSVAVGIWVGVGSRDEPTHLAGATHYLEHLLFKGTKRRTSLQISSSIEAVGGDINAFTAKEYTCYHAHVLDVDLPLALDVLADMVTSSVVAEPDVDSERQVVLEEIAMRDDEPDDAVHDLFAAGMWGDRSPLGRSILGSPETINALSRRAVHGWYRRRYRPENLVIAVAGHLDHASVVRMVRAAFDVNGYLEGDAAPSPSRIGGRRPRVRPGVQLVERATEQANLILGVPSVSRTDERRFALGVLNAALGGGMSSRLFQEVREKRGLAYSVYSYAAQYADTGMLGIYVGCAPKKVDQVVALCREELARVAEHGITPDELARGKGQLRGGLVLGLEDTASRMGRIAKAELVYAELPSVDELIARVDAVSLDDVSGLAADLLGAKPLLAVIGPFDDDERFSRAVA